MANTTTRGVRIPDDEWDAAKARAKENHEILASVIRRLLREYARGAKQ